MTRDAIETLPDWIDNALIGFVPAISITIWHDWIDYFSYMWNVGELRQNYKSM